VRQGVHSWAFRVLLCYIVTGWVWVGTRLACGMFMKGLPYLVLGWDSVDEHLLQRIYFASHYMAL
jgi:hypothetical protein